MIMTTRSRIALRIGAGAALVALLGGCATAPGYYGAAAEPVYYPTYPTYPVYEQPGYYRPPTVVVPTYPVAPPPRYIRDRDDRDDWRQRERDRDDWRARERERVDWERRERDRMAREAAERDRRDRDRRPAPGGRPPYDWRATTPSATIKDPASGP